MLKLPVFTVKKFAGILCLLCIVNCHAYAQLPVCVTPSSNPDNIWGSHNGKVFGSATIDYTPNCSSCIPGSGSAQLSATVESTECIIGDGISTITIPSSSLNPNPFDVIIGNDSTSTGDYLLGLVSGNGAILTIYNIVAPGTGSFAANFNATYTISSSAVIGRPRIDIIAEYGNNFPTSIGLPFSNKFVMSWADASGLEAYYATLNSPTIGTVKTVVSSSNIKQPSVAAIQRDVKSNTDDIALIAYEDASTTPANVEYTEWNITANTVSIPIIIGALSSFNNYRIAAIDDHTINSPTLPSPLAYYCIVGSESSSHDVLMHNNLSGTVNLTGSSCLSGLNGAVWPMISAGPDGHYTIIYNSNTNSSDYNAIANIVDWTNGTAAPAFYRVSFNPDIQGGIYVLTSSSCNTEDVSQATFLFYEDFSDAAILYKNTYFPYAFKETGTANTAAQQNWNVYPVPSNDYINVTPPESFKNNNLNYKLIDMTGRTVQAGTLSAGTPISVGGLAPGVCSITVYQDGVKLYSQLVVKQ